MRKRTFTGWVGKYSGVMWDSRHGDFAELCGIYQHKESEMDWAEEDWPPVKVRVTVEPVEKGEK